MADVKTAPPVAAASGKSGPASTPSAAPNKPGDGKGGGGGGGGRRSAKNRHNNKHNRADKGEKGESNSELSGGNAANTTRPDGGGGERSDSASGGRRSGKRPEVQHYKPGAFSGSRKPEDCEGNPGNSNNSTATEKTSSTGGKGGQPSEDKPQQPHLHSDRRNKKKQDQKKPSGGDQEKPKSAVSVSQSDQSDEKKGDEKKGQGHNNNKRNNNKSGNNKGNKKDGGPGPSDKVTQGEQNHSRVTNGVAEQQSQQQQQGRKDQGRRRDGGGGPRRHEEDDNQQQHHHQQQQQRQNRGGGGKHRQGGGGGRGGRGRGHRSTGSSPNGPRSKTKSPSPGAFGGGRGRGTGSGDDRRLFDPKKPLPTSFSVGADLSNNASGPGIIRRPSTPSGGGGGPHHQRGIITLPARTPSPMTAAGAAGSLHGHQGHVGGGPQSLPLFPHPASSDRRSNSPPPGLMNRRDFPNLKNNHRGTWGKGLGGSSSGVDSWRSGPPNVRGTRDEDAFANGPRRGPGGYDMDPRDYNRWNDYDHGKPPSGKYVPSSLTQQQQSSQQASKAGLPPRFLRSQHHPGGGGGGFETRRDSVSHSHNSSSSDWSWRGGGSGGGQQESLPLASSTRKQPSAVPSGHTGPPTTTAAAAASPSLPAPSLLETDFRSSSISKVHDWSLEVEEEEEWNNQRRRMSESSEQSLSEKTSSFRESFKSMGRPLQQPQAGLIHMPSSNWRDDCVTQQQGSVNLDSQHRGHHGQSSNRFLFDPKKPDRVPRLPFSNSAPGGGGEHPARFPVDPRFAHPWQPGPGGQTSQQMQHHQQPRPLVTPHQQQGGTSYRPPFPQRYQPPHQKQYQGHPSTPTRHYDWQQQEGPSKKASPLIEAIQENKVHLESIWTSGGGHLLSRLWNSDVGSARHRILQAFQALLETDLVYCVREELEFVVWRTCFYNLVESLKTVLNDDGGKNFVGKMSHDRRAMDELKDQKRTVERNIGELLDEGLNFYLAMIDTLDNTYGIGGLEKYYDVLEPRSSDKMVKCALVSAQNCLLCLGDLARYKEQIQNTTNFGKARQFYQKASHIDTRNGRPYFLLAVLANMTKRRFEAVYFNMRCLTTKSPLNSSKESLTVIFEEVSKKWENMEQRRLEERDAKRKEESSRHTVKGHGPGRLRNEIWVRPEGGGRRLHRTTSAQEELEAGDAAASTAEAELSNLSTSDLNRRFNNTFLYLVGKLYTNINIDTFAAAADLLQKEFRILLSRSPLPIDSKRLVQIMALNMFVIDDTKAKSGNTSGGGKQRTLAQISALQLAFEMFGVLLERCNILMQGFEPDISVLSHTIFPDEDLASLLTAVKVWCDWLLENSDIWHPIVCTDPFTELAKLATQLERIRPSLQPILRQIITEQQLEDVTAPHGGNGGGKGDHNRNDFEMIKLTEDAILCGFNPWFRGHDWSIYRRYCHKSVMPSLAQDVRRLDAINDCIDYLEGFEPPILKWSKPDNAHISLVEEAMNVSSLPPSMAAAGVDFSKAGDILEEAYSDEECETSSSAQLPSMGEKVMSSLDDEGQSEHSEQIKQLKLRRDELERRKRDEARQRDYCQRLNEEVGVTLEVCPKIVVPDTNCFVDSLSDLQRLSALFQLRVPLVVLGELDGLAKGARQASKYASVEHAAMVAENARLALNFLQQRDRPPPTSSIKCVTSKGTLLPTFNLLDEAAPDASEGKTNDDLILDTCVSLSLAQSSSASKADSESTDASTGRKVRHLYREVVLLTDDRNLKLKAHVTDIPVNNLSEFVKWAYTK